MNESYGNNEYEQGCFENIKLTAVSAVGIGALICSALLAFRYFCGGSRNVRSAVKKRGKGYSAVYISADSRSKGSIPAFLLTAAAGCFAALLYAIEKNNGLRIDKKEL